MTSDAETRINLTALKHRDPYISNITDAATQVAVYTFNHSSSEWEKTDIEGTLFVYQRIAPPYTGFTILNRLKKDTLTEPLTSDIEFQNQSPFLLYRNAKLQIYGIWFYDMYDCNRIGKLLVDQCSGIKKASSGHSADDHRAPKMNNLPPTSSTGSSSASSVSDNALDDEVISSTENSASDLQGGEPPSVNLMDILSKAKLAYDKRHASPNAERKAAPATVPVRDLFKPINSGKNRKVNVESLFESCDNNQKNAKQTARSSSAELFEKVRPEKSAVREIPSRRRAARSLSLSVGPGQSPPTTTLNSAATRNVVNGAISVEELESPVLGVPGNRTRYHSVSDPLDKNAASLPKSACDDSAFVKLLNKMAVSGRTANGRTSSPAQDHHHSALVAGDASDVQGLHATAKIDFSQRALLNRNLANHALNAEKTGGRCLSSSLSPSFNAAPPLPVVHEQRETSQPLISKSMSVATGLAHLNVNTRSSPLQNAVLHGSSSISNVKLLSPDVLRATAPVHTVSDRPTTAVNHAAFSEAKTMNATYFTEASVDDVQTARATNETTLISPDDFKCAASALPKADDVHLRLLQANVSNQPSVFPPLDKQKLAETIVHLLQTDSAFLAAIHNAYLTGFENHASDQQSSSDKLLPPPVFK